MILFVLIFIVTMLQQYISANGRIEEGRMHKTPAAPGRGDDAAGGGALSALFWCC